MMAAGLGAGMWWAASYLLVAVALAAQARSSVGRAARNAVTRFGPRSARALLATAAGVTLTFGALPRAQANCQLIKRLRRPHNQCQYNPSLRHR